MCGTSVQTAAIFFPGGTMSEPQPPTRELELLAELRRLYGRIDDLAAELEKLMWPRLAAFAVKKLGGPGPKSTMQPSLLVNEAIRRMIARKNTEPVKDPYAFACKIIDNELRDYWAGQAKRDAAGLDNRQIEHWDGVAAPAAEPPPEVLDELRRHNANWHAAYTLAQEGYTYEEVGQRLQRPKATAHNWCKEAKAWLAARLSAPPPPRGDGAP